MRILIVAAVAAIVAVITVLVLKHVEGPWQVDSSIRTAVAGAVAGIASTVVSRSLRKDG